MSKKWSKKNNAIFEEMKNFFGTCVRCDGQSNLLNLEKDHIVPSYQGGADIMTNIQPLCARCNSSKGSENIDHRIGFCIRHNLKMPKEWL